MTSHSKNAGVFWFASHATICFHMLLKISFVFNGARLILTSNVGWFSGLSLHAPKERIYFHCTRSIITSLSRQRVVSDVSVPSGRLVLLTSSWLPPPMLYSFFRRLS
jgi:hypothetical protein